MTFSFIRRGTLYQVLRLDLSDEQEGALAGQIRLTLGGMVQFAHTHSETPNTIRNKCFPYCDRNQIICFDSRLYRYNGKTGGYEDINLHDSDEKKDTGKAHTSEGRNVWRGRYATAVPFSRTDTGSLQTAVFVAAFRMVDGKDVCMVENKPLPRQIWKPDMDNSSSTCRYVGANSSNGKSATAFMWEKIFLGHYLPRNPLSQLAELHLIGRTLEKILDVDIMLADCLRKKEERASANLVSNLFLEPAADYKSLL